VTWSVAARTYAPVATGGCHDVLKLEWFVSQAVQTLFPAGVKGHVQLGNFQELNVFACPLAPGSGRDGLPTLRFKDIIVSCQENRSFDHFFGFAPQVQTAGFGPPEGYC
jgi:phospholipase C